MRGYSAHLMCATVGSARTSRDAVALVNSFRVDVSCSLAGDGAVDIYDPTGSALCRLGQSVRVGPPLLSSPVSVLVWSRSLVASRPRVVLTRGSEKRCDTD